MAIDKQRSEMQRQSAAEYKLQKYASKLRQQWTQREDKHCLHSDWNSLARSVGLGTSDIPYLQAWVAQNGLKPPARRKPPSAKPPTSM